METTNNASGKNRDLRSRTSAEVIQFDKAVLLTGSQRAAAKATGIARSTAQSRIERRKERTLPLSIQDFLDTEEGMQFIHRLIVAIEFIITQIAGGGIRVVQLFLELTELDQWVASSFGSVKNRVETMENNIIRFGAMQESTLKNNMRTRSITACLDETFPSGICLVAIEPVSNFILLETLTDDRTSQTWKCELDKRLETLPIKINQVTADGATALVRLAQTELGAHYSPDLFHIQREISKATSAPLASKTTACECTAETLEKTLNKKLQDEQDYVSLEVKPVGRPINYEGCISDAAIALGEAQYDLRQARTRQEQVRESVKAIGDIYHPVNLGNGAKRTPNRLEKLLTNEMEKIELHAKDANLSDNSLKKIEKAKRAIEPMKETLRYFWVTVSTLLSSMQLTNEQKRVFERLLLPITYIELQLPKSRDAEHKNELKSVVDQLRNQLDSEEVWAKMTEQEKNSYQQKALECAQLFQRSTSNVEGRNGCLSLHHHAFRQMNVRKLGAATVVHNYFIRRSNGTTAAERFFEQDHEDLFKWLVRETDYPPQSRSWASKRKNAA